MPPENSTLRRIENRRKHFSVYFRGRFTNLEFSFLPFAWKPEENLRNNALEANEPFVAINLVTLPQPSEARSKG
jgi:hypothetical protein